ncbi:MAG: hypothetical protein C0485_19370 [Pirellula sp.]|nr:hypothetical protein [Pirellula sp.]
MTLGCSGSGGAGVTGKVTYNGAPVEKGSIAFHPVASGTPFGAPVENGEFKAEKATPGKYRTLVRGMRTDAKPPTREEAGDGPLTPSLDYIAEDAAGNSQEVEIAGNGQTIEIAITGAAVK